MFEKLNASYKEIHALNNENKFTPSDVIMIVLSFVILTGVFGLFGYFFDQFKNIHYIFLTQLFTAAIMTYLVTSKRFFIKPDDVTINSVVILSVLEMIAVITLANSFIFGGFLSSNVSGFLFVIISIIGISLTIIDFIFTLKTRSYTRIKIIRTSIVLFIAYRFCGYILPIKTLEVSYIIGFYFTGLILMIFTSLHSYLYKNTAHSENILLLMAFTVITAFIVYLALFSVDLKSKLLSTNHEDMIIEEQLIYEPNIIRDLELEDSITITQMTMYRIDDSYYINDEINQAIVVFDNEFTLQKTISYRGYDIGYIFENEGHIYFEKRAETVEDESVIHTNDYRELYILNESDEIELVIKLWMENYSKVFVTITGIYHFEYSDYWVNGSGNFISDHYGVYEETRYKGEDYLDTEIIYQDIDDIMFTKDGYLIKDFSTDPYHNYFRSAMYSNGKIIQRTDQLIEVYENGRITEKTNQIIEVYDLDNYLNNEDPIFEKIFAEDIEPNSNTFIYYNNRYFLSLGLFNNSSYDYFLDTDGTTLSMTSSKDQGIYYDNEIIVYSNLENHTYGEDFSNYDYNNYLLDYDNPFTLTLYKTSNNTKIAYIVLTTTFIGLGFTSVSSKMKEYDQKQY